MQAARGVDRRPLREEVEDDQRRGREEQGHRHEHGAEAENVAHNAGHERSCAEPNDVAGGERAEPAAFLAWRLYFGMMDKFAYRETTLLLRFPLGWAYALGFVGAVIMVVVALYVLARSLGYAARGEAEPRQAGAEV